MPSTLEGMQAVAELHKRLCPQQHESLLRLGWPLNRVIDDNLDAEFPAYFDED